MLHKTISFTLSTALIIGLIPGCTSQKKEHIEQHSKQKLPKDLLFRGKPISNAIMSCLLCLGGPGPTIKGINIDEYAQLEKNGEITDPNKEGSTFHWSYVGVLSQEYHVIDAYEWPEGAMGKFTCQSILKRDGNNLKVVESIYGGDRHSSMLQGSNIVDSNSLIYTQNMTPGWLYEKIMEQYPELKQLSANKSQKGLFFGEADYIGLATFKVTFNPEKGIETQLVSFTSASGNTLDGIQEIVQTEDDARPAALSLTMGDALDAAIGLYVCKNNSYIIPENQLKEMMQEAFHYAKDADDIS